MSRIGSVSPQSASQKTEENVKSLLFHTLRSKPAEEIIHTIPRPSSSDVKTLLGLGMMYFYLVLTYSIQSLNVITY